MFRVDGIQLNGLTTGADFGDDGKMATNFPQAYVENYEGAGSSFISVKTFGFDQMSPRPGQPGQFFFNAPGWLGVTPGTHQVGISVNGVPAKTRAMLTVPYQDVGAAFVAVLSGA